VATSPSVDPRWRKSSASGKDNCVEVFFVERGAVLVRNSRVSDGPVLRFTSSEWEAFLAGVRLGEFDVLSRSQPAAVEGLGCPEQRPRDVA
jgi:hypothetical protein